MPFIKTTQGPATAKNEVSPDPGQVFNKCLTPGSKKTRILSEPSPALRIPVPSLHVARLRLRPCLLPSWCGTSRTNRGCWKLWSVPSPPRAAALATLLRRKAFVKHEWENNWKSHNLNIL